MWIRKLLNLEPILAGAPADNCPKIMLNPKIYGLVEGFRRRLQLTPGGT